MLRKWLDSTPSAYWNDLIQTITDIELTSEASQIKRLLMQGEYAYTETVVLFMDLIFTNFMKKPLVLKI